MPVDMVSEQYMLQEGKKGVITYGSKVFTKEESRYGATRRELLAEVL